MRKRGKSKTCHKFYEEKGEFGGPGNESLRFKWGTPTIFGPKSSHSNKL